MRALTRPILGIEVRGGISFNDRSMIRFDLENDFSNRNDRYVDSIAGDFYSKNSFFKILYEKELREYGICFVFVFEIIL